MEEEFVEPPAGHKFHREVGATLVRADLEDLHDVDMLQPGGRLAFHLKPVKLARAREIPRQDHLQRDVPVQADLPRPVDDSHAAAADLLDQLVVADPPSRWQFHDRRGRLFAEARTSPL